MNFKFINKIRRKFNESKIKNLLYNQYYSPNILFYILLRKLYLINEINDLRFYFISIPIILNFDKF